MPEPATYAIVCDANKHNSEGVAILALVDKAKSTFKGNKRVWWVENTPDSIMRYRDVDKAKAKCQQFKHNNPRVVFFDDAWRLVEAQRKALEAHRGA